MRKIKLVDSTFTTQNAIGLAGDNQWEYPKSFHWDRLPGDAFVRVFTDVRLEDAITDNSERKIGWLLESPAFLDIERVINLASHFHTIFTHNKKLIELGKPFRFYPLGGSWIKEWGMFPKSETVSLITSDKYLTSGHKLRHKVAKTYGDRLHIWGLPYNGRFNPKSISLRPYRYSVVIENVREDWYFSEKLIDCLSQGTVPIYWGSDLSCFFNMDGIITMTAFTQLRDILDSLNVEDYESRLEAVKNNLDLAYNYRCCEDWVCQEYYDLF